MTELRTQINNIVEDHQECLILAKSVGSLEVYNGTTATEEDILEGKTAYSNGKLIEGKMIPQDGNLDELQNKIDELEQENNALSNEIVLLKNFAETEMGNPIILNDCLKGTCELYPYGATYQSAKPTVNSPVEVVTLGINGSIEIKVDNGLEETDSDYMSYMKTLPVQKEFCKIGDYQDYFSKENGHWYENHGYNIKILTGGFEATGLSDCFVLQNAMTDNSIAGDYGYCDYFYVDPDWAVTGGWTTLSDNYMVCGRTTTHQIIIRCSDFDGDVAGFNAMLKEKQPKLYYQLNNPIKLACTEEQEKILNGLYTYDGNTTITIDNIGQMKVKYQKIRATGTLTKENPIEIDNYNGNVQIQIIRKNILDISSLKRFAAYEGEYNIIDTGMRVICWNETLHVPMRFIAFPLTNYKGKNLTFSAYAKSSSTNEGMLLLTMGDSTGANLTGTVYSEETIDGQLSVTIHIPTELPSTSTHLIMMVYGRRNTVGSGAGAYVDYTNMQIEVGDTMSKYTPYMGTDQTITSNAIAQGDKVIISLV